MDSNHDNSDNGEEHVIIKLLEGAEEMALLKPDLAGNIREFDLEHIEDFLPDKDAQADEKSLPGYAEVQLYHGQSIIQLLENLELIERIHPLHDKENLKKLGKEWYWALLKRQPIAEIREYFGEAVALYFNFLGFYTTALIIPMTLGFLQLIVSQETLAFFCVFNVIWVTVFLELWKRRCSELAFDWGTINMTSLDEPRPNYHGTMGIDAVSGKVQPQYPRWKTNMKLYCVSLPIVILCLLAAFWVMLLSFWFEDTLRTQQTDSTGFGAYIILLPGIVYTGIVYISNLYYRKIATQLTEWENHRTQSQFDRHRVLKLMLFEFINNFMSLFYIAFWLRDLDLLRQQLATMLIILQAFSHLEEAALPLTFRWCHHKISDLINWQASKYVSLKTKEEIIPLLPGVEELQSDDPVVQQANEEGEMDDYTGTYDDYLELFVQFGYVVLFSSAYPLAAFWAVVNNVLEIRADAFKLCTVFRRPMAKRVKDIGAWQVAFEALGAISIVTNCGLLCISPQMARIRTGLNMSPVEWLLFFVGLEHCLLGIKHILHRAIPDKPEWVRVALAKRQYESQRALKNERRQKSQRILTRRFKTVHGRPGQKHKNDFQ
ncbi:anoctamin-10-like [Ctenocephalides felis]|uniref:anoctamin-10-like n=1 Tax=Ctenocephalides felis TaxID=7515 RepID=UPI000E6E20D3|nr:anoctamin-10-like [Ctenocephalides felis]